MLKLISLNIENDKHIDLVVPFFKSQNADIILIQELYKCFIPVFEKELGMVSVFAPLCQKLVNDNPQEWGIAIFSKYKIEKQHK